MVKFSCVYVPRFCHRQLELSREVRLRELRNQVINKVSAHPGGKRILVATRDSTLRMIDLQSTSVIQWFHVSFCIELMIDLKLLARNYPEISIVYPPDTRLGV